tara:strand:- start:33 stop:506 length:474 start_codon:yes stop_codon:yes gene_type:complete
MSEQSEETMNESYLINWDGYGFEIEFEDSYGGWDKSEICWDGAPLNLIAQIHFASVDKNGSPRCDHLTLESLMSDLEDEEARIDLIDIIRDLDTVQTANYGPDAAYRLEFRLKLEADQMEKLLAIEAVKLEIFDKKVKVVKCMSNADLAEKFDMPPS